MKISQFKSALQLAKPTDNPQFLQSNGVPLISSIQMHSSSNEK
jgi:hypothetical protein